MVGLGALPPVDAADRIARLVAAELPEGLADADPPAAVNALRHGRSHLFRGDLQGRQPTGGLLRPVADLEPRALHHAAPAGPAPSTAFRKQAICMILSNPHALWADIEP